MLNTVESGELMTFRNSAYQAVVLMFECLGTRLVCVCVPIHFCPRNYFSEILQLYNHGNHNIPIAFPRIPRSMLAPLQYLVTAFILTIDNLFHIPLLGPMMYSPASGILSGRRR